MTNPLHALFQESQYARVVAWLLWGVTIGVLVAIPFKIISEGFTREDDALRHEAVVVVIGVLFICLASGKSFPDLLKMPAFLMVVICWGLAFKNGRFWHDWGMHALLLWIVQVIEPVWMDRLLRTVYRRLAIGLS